MRRPSSEALDLATWPGIDVTALEAEARERYRRRAAAIEHYRCGLSLSDIREKTTIDRRVLYRMLDRALRTHPGWSGVGFSGADSGAAHQSL
jgi:hypothetical protein